MKSNSLSYCIKENKPCIGWWVDEYFKDCLCNLNDQVSFGLGIVSLVCWGVSEIPQIITNFQTKSSHGVSLSFLLTWIAGDIFNLLYTRSPVILVLQSLYYDHIYSWLKSRKAGLSAGREVEEARKPLKPTISDSPSCANRASPSHRLDYYYMSARSMAGGSTPPN